MDTLSVNKDVKAKKEHPCDFCCEKIKQGETYIKSTHKQDETIYDWKTHKHCAEIAVRLNMYMGSYEGVTTEDFQETIHSEYFDLVIAKFSKEDIVKYSTIIQELRKVSFNHKLNFVIRHYAKIDKTKL